MGLYGSKMTLGKYQQRIIEWWKNTTTKNEVELANTRKEREESSKLEASLKKPEYKLLGISEDGIQSVVNTLQNKKLETLEEITSQIYRSIKENRFDLAKGSIGLAYSTKIIDDTQKDFLTDLVTKTESEGLDGSIKRLGSEENGAGFYFQDTEQLNLTASTFLSLYAEKHAPDEKTRLYLKNLKSKVEGMHEELASLSNSRDKEGSLFISFRNRSKYILDELETYENFCEGKPFKIHSLSANNSETSRCHKLPREQQIEQNNLFIREEIEKITKLRDYFNKKVDDFVLYDLIQLAPFCYIGTSSENIKESVRQLINKSGLEDITPKIGDKADPLIHKIRVMEVGYNTSEKIIEVLLPGFKYNGQVWRRPEVYVGR